MTSFPVAAALESLGCHHATVDLFKSIERRPNHLPSVKALATELDYRASTLLARFHRAGLPSMYDMIRRIRLVHLRRLYEADPSLNEQTLAAVAGFSGVTAFSRHLRDYCKQGYREWRQARTADEELAIFLNELVLSPLYAPRWRAFRLFEERMAA